ncbi:anthranilate phosphoribosyltransferase [Ferrimonas lipolytica]|uniref:Anthranilate phosphoribosyltransferase n=1 Tax=Ferrimonas lipolytica TaxID=2724191 RepID=A0A6H1UBB0_9GAMM|nr:anthranilate phosphoribosyltransferase [Ferrimonas lipolytica]QIZ75870.1 anthranilate phosphoribosyltransferase [Ferrimonas lipolytica]
MLITDLLAQLIAGQSLSREQSKFLFGQVVKGEVTEAQLASALTALKIKGETIDEITGAAEALRQAATPFPRPQGDLLDIVGTGGDGANTINISTTATFIAAAAGARVAKHGSRSVSSKSGSSDLLTKFGINLTMTPEQSAQCLNQLGVTFLFAPHYHAGMKYAAPVRQQLKTRTLFNIMGPLINPARPNQMLLGVYAAELVEPIAKVLQGLGVERALVVHGLGLDELAVHGDSHVIELKDGQLYPRVYTPEELGVDQFDLTELEGGEPEHNMAISTELLGGGGTAAQRAAVAVNAGAGLYLAGKVDTIAAGTKLALATMDSGKALELINQFAEASQ